MPLVVVTRDPAKISLAQLKPIVDALPKLVAEALNVPDSEGSLTSGEVTVRVQDFGPIDVNTKDVEIIIWANSYPARLKTLDVRRESITQRVKSMLPHNVHGFVWVLLQQGSFEEF